MPRRKGNAVGQQQGDNLGESTPRISSNRPVGEPSIVNFAERESTRLVTNITTTPEMTNLQVQFEIMRLQMIEKDREREFQRLENEREHQRKLELLERQKELSEIKARMWHDWTDRISGFDIRQSRNEEDNDRKPEIEQKRAEKHEEEEADSGESREKKTDEVEIPGSGEGVTGCGKDHEQHREESSFANSGVCDEDKNHCGDEEKKGKLEWRETVYPVEKKIRNEWHSHHCSPITQQQFVSVGPTKENLTPLKRIDSNVSGTSALDRKSDSPKDMPEKGTKRSDSIGIIKETKEERNSTNQSDRTFSDKEEVSKSDDANRDNRSSVAQDQRDGKSAKSRLVQEEGSEDKADKDGKETEKCLSTEKRNFVPKQDRDDGRSRKRKSSRGYARPRKARDGENRYDSSRDRGRGAVNTTETYRGRREYRRSRVKLLREAEEKSNGKKSKYRRKQASDDYESSGSETEQWKQSRLRQKDEDSEVSPDEIGAPTTESVPGEKNRGDSSKDDKISNSESSHVQESKLIWTKMKYRCRVGKSGRMP